MVDSPNLIFISLEVILLLILSSITLTLNNSNAFKFPLKVECLSYLSGVNCIDWVNSVTVYRAYSR